MCLQHGPEVGKGRESYSANAGRPTGFDASRGIPASITGSQPRAFMPTLT
ncbi:MAG: hypothetical protein ACKO1O_03450 [Erythrobacter sp.]